MVEIATDTPSDPAALLQLLAARDAEVRAKDLLIEKLKLQLANLRRHRFGSTAQTYRTLMVKDFIAVLDRRL